MPEFVIYSTPGCHLCEEAKRLAQSVLGEHLTEIDIAADERLLALYGVRIPVLRRLDTGTEIDWPFGREEVLKLIK